MELHTKHISLLHIAMCTNSYTSTHGHANATVPAYSDGIPVLSSLTRFSLLLHAIKSGAAATVRAVLHDWNATVMLQIQTDFRMLLDPSRHKHHMHVSHVRPLQLQTSLRSLPCGSWSSAPHTMPLHEFNGHFEHFIQFHKLSRTLYKHIKSQDK